MKKIALFLVISDYYLASLLLVWAGTSKLSNPGVGDLLETLFNRNILTLDQLVLVSRWYPPLEICFGVFALTGLFSTITARLMGSLYLFFTLLIFFVSEGYLLLPINCGCFGEGGQSPAYLLMIRNTILALPLFFFSKSHRNWTLASFFYRHSHRS